MSIFGRFAPRLQEAIVARLGWSRLRPVQEAAGEALLAGENAVVLAPAAGGKTEAAMFPILSDLISWPAEGVGALYVAPLDALLDGQAGRLGLYAGMVGLRCFVWRGDTSIAEQRRFLCEPAELLMTTAESLELMLTSPRVDEEALFLDLRAVIIDEVHALAGTDRGAHLMSVIERIAALGGWDVQRVGLGVSVGNPEAILKWLQGSSQRPGSVVGPPRRHILHILDLGHLDRALQAETPDTVRSFLQHTGHTDGRSGPAAHCGFFSETVQGVLQAIALVELARAGWVEEVDMRTRCWPVLVHQLLAMVLAGGGVSSEEAWAQLVRVPDLAGIRRAEYERLVAWMLGGELLALGSGQMVLGPKLARRFRRRDFLELYAVFSSPQGYAVWADAGEVVGTLSQAFVDRLVEGVSCFLLAGRAWTVVQVQHGARQVRVAPAARGREPTWGGFLPQFLGVRVCQQIRHVLASDEPYPYLDTQTAAVLAAQRAAFAGVLAPAARGGVPDGVEVAAGELRWWTFAGGRINDTLRHALEVLGGWRIVADDYVLRVRGDGLDQGAFGEAALRLREQERWADDGLWQDVAARLSGNRLSKLQSLVPPWVAREMLTDCLLDVDSAWRWVSRSLDEACMRCDL